MEDSEMANFQVAARTLLHLGSELITSDEVAIYELLKNAFDAESPRVKIRIMCPVNSKILRECNTLLAAQFNKKNIVLCELKADLIDKIKGGWILKGEDGSIIDSENKLYNIHSADNIDTLKNACLKLNYIEITDSGKGMDENNLLDAFLKIGTSYKDINGIKTDGKAVLGNKGIGRLSMMRLGGKSLIETWCKGSEYLHAIEFDWQSFDSSDLLLSEINFPILKMNDKPSEQGTRITIYSLFSDWTETKIQDEIVNNFLRRMNNPFEKMPTNFPVDLYFNNDKRVPIKPINPELLKLADRDMSLEFFPRKSMKDSDEILKSTIETPSKEFSKKPQSRTLRDFKSKFNCSLDDLEKIGPFSLKIRWFNRAKLAQKGLGSDLSRFRKELDFWNGGVAIYRDGFRIGLSGSSKDGDWLGIDNEAFRGQGLTLNRIQTVGALEITKKNNPHLIDRSNREGLVDNDSIILLRKILREFALNELREQVRLEEKVQKKTIEAHLLDDGLNSMESRLMESEKIIHEIQEISPEAKKHVTALHQNIQFITNNVKKFQKAMTELQERREDILELAGVGNVMRSIMHELTRTTGQTRLLLNQVAKKADNETADLLKKLESEIKSLNIRLSQLDPLSTNKRNRSGDFELMGLIKTIISGYTSRFERHNIDYIITFNGKILSSETLMVKMVKGFVSLTIENLILNSIYWLKTGFLQPGEEKAKITINVDSYSKVIEVYDNGPGISPTDKERIFNPGFSLRKDGRGYGLYIAKEVSANYHSNI
ncbi:histidine kinase, partial [Klebsiella michiganensis]|nr:histidine kinase [Klebsiella michiganensis]